MNLEAEKKAIEDAIFAVGKAFTSGSVEVSKAIKVSYHIINSNSRA
jgi:hypothetical protein